MTTETRQPDKSGKKSGKKNAIERNPDGTFTKEGARHANPTGRPIGAKNFTTKVREALKKIAESRDGVDITYEQQLIEKVLKKAIVEGDKGMIVQVWDQLDGRPAQKVDVTSGGEPIEGFTYLPPAGK